MGYSAEKGTQAGVALDYPPQLFSTAAKLTKGAQLLVSISTAMNTPPYTILYKNTADDAVRLPRLVGYYHIT